MLTYHVQWTQPHEALPQSEDMRDLAADRRVVRAFDTDSVASLADVA